MSTEPYDPRCIANLILEEGWQTSRPITNLALQKLLYFAHAIFLVERKKPLVSGYFEAWQYGPVHPVVYQSFKKSKDKPISFKAMGSNIMTGEQVKLSVPEDQEIVAHIRRVMAFYGRLTPGRLVDISHAKDAPWAYVVEKGSKSIALGLRIADDVIVNRFKYHKISVAPEPIVGEPSEDSPFT